MIKNTHAPQQFFRLGPSQLFLSLWVQRRRPRSRNENTSVRFCGDFPDISEPFPDTAPGTGSAGPASSLCGLPPSPRFPPFLLGGNCLLQLRWAEIHAGSHLLNVPAQDGQGSSLDGRKGSVNAADMWAAPGGEDEVTGTALSEGPTDLRSASSGQRLTVRGPGPCQTTEAGGRKRETQ